MICEGCGVERKIEHFAFYHNSETRYKVCKFCLKERVKDCQTEGRLREKTLQLKSMKILLTEIIEACETKNSRRLKLCIEKAKVEVKGVYTRKDVQ